MAAAREAQERRTDACEAGSGADAPREIVCGASAEIN